MLAGSVSLMKRLADQKLWRQELNIREENWYFESCLETSHFMFLLRIASVTLKGKRNSGTISDISFSYATSLPSDEIFFLNPCVLSLLYIKLHG